MGDPARPHATRRDGSCPTGIAPSSVELLCSIDEHGNRGPAARVLGLQRVVGNQQLQRALHGGPVPERVAHAIRDRGPGVPLPDRTRTLLGATFGASVGDVRVHADAAAAAAADATGAEAFTFGRDVFFGSGRYAPDDTHGRHVLAHEVAHAVQQHRVTADAVPEAIAAEGSVAEREAQRAAVAAERGEAASLGPAPPHVHRFAQADGSAERGGHAYMTEQALSAMGLSEHQARVGRMGNWERDLSQVITPTTAPVVEEIMPLLNVMAIQEFGRGINPAQFGTYDPVEHIDNPTGLRGSDVIDQYAAASDGTPQVGTNPMRTDGTNHDFAGPGGALTSGPDDQAYADRDLRYQQGVKPSNAYMNPNDAAAYRVDDSGIPQYIYTSRNWLTGALRKAAQMGRQQHANGDEQLHGPRLFASGVHTLQDYFAHSNFCEVAINQLIRSGQLRVLNSAGSMQGIPYVPGGADNRVLDTQVHANDAHGNLMGGNLAFKGREVLSTGSFNLSDTAASLLEEVSDHWKLLNPFKEKTKGPSKLVDACLDYLEMDPATPTKFNGLGKLFGDKVRSVADTFSFAPDMIVNPLRSLAETLDQQEHTARSFYHWLDDHGPLDILKRQAPRPVAAAIESLQDWMRQKKEAVLGEAWNMVVDAGEKRIRSVIDKIKGMTNVQNKKAAPLNTDTGNPLVDGWRSAKNWVAKKFGNVGDMYDPHTGAPKNGIAPASYTPPSHTQVAKDHGELASPVKDGKPDTDHEADEHGHEHISAWLNPLASKIAELATQAVGTKVSAVWDRVDRGEVVNDADPMLDAITEEVNRWMRHPQDNAALWAPLVTRNLGRTPLGAQLLEQLADAKASVPDAPSGVLGAAPGALGAAAPATFTHAPEGQKKNTP